MIISIYACVLLLQRFDTEVLISYLLTLAYHLMGVQDDININRIVIMGAYLYFARLIFLQNQAMLLKILTPPVEAHFERKVFVPDTPQLHWKQRKET